MKVIGAIIRGRDAVFACSVRAVGLLFSVSVFYIGFLGVISSGAFSNLFRKD